MTFPARALTEALETHRVFSTATRWPRGDPGVGGESCPGIASARRGENSGEGGVRTLRRDRQENRGVACSADSGCYRFATSAEHGVREPAHRLAVLFLGVPEPVAVDAERDGRIQWPSSFATCVTRRPCMMRRLAKVRRRPCKLITGQISVMPLDICEGGAWRVQPAPLPRVHGDDRRGIGGDRARSGHRPR